MPKNIYEFAICSPKDIVWRTHPQSPIPVSSSSTEMSDDDADADDNDYDDYGDNDEEDEDARSTQFVKFVPLKICLLNNWNTWGSCVSFNIGIKMLPTKLGKITN